MDRHTAESLDHWLTTPPEPSDYEDEDNECVRCGALLPSVPDRTEGHVYYAHCVGRGPLDAPGLAHLMGCKQCRSRFRNRDDYVPDCESVTGHQPHLFEAHGWEIEFRECPVCKHENTRVQA